MTRRSTACSAFTLIEMLTTVAVLVIVFGLMVSLARDVRQRSAVDLTGQLLAKLDVLTGQYLQQYGALPSVFPFLSPGQHPPDEQTLRENARLNNEQFVRLLRGSSGLAKQLNDLPSSIYNEASLLDAWGTPVILMPAMHSAIGMAPENRYFLFSAGPDRRFLTRDDNLYSYDQSPALPATQPVKSP